jgi:hypothetical protein
LLVFCLPQPYFSKHFFNLPRELSSKTRNVAVKRNVTRNSKKNRRTTI